MFHRLSSTKQPRAILGLIVLWVIKWGSSCTSPYIHLWCEIPWKSFFLQTFASQNPLRSVKLDSQGAMFVIFWRRGWFLITIVHLLRLAAVSHTFCLRRRSHKNQCDEHVPWDDYMIDEDFLHAGPKMMQWLHDLQLKILETCLEKPKFWLQSSLSLSLWCSTPASRFLAPHLGTTCLRQPLAHLKSGNASESLSSSYTQVRQNYHWFQDGYGPTSLFFGINWLITVTDINCLGMNAGVTDTDLVVLSTISRAYGILFVTTVTITDFNSAGINYGCRCRNWCRL